MIVVDVFLVLQKIITFFFCVFLFKIVCGPP